MQLGQCHWWRQSGSNRSPSACKADALPDELCPPLRILHFRCKICNAPCQIYFVYCILCACKFALSRTIIHANMIKNNFIVYLGSIKMMQAVIHNIHAREVIDSRGELTLEVDVFLDGGYRGRFIVPSGMSKGKFEAVAVVDDNKRKTLSCAIANSKKIFAHVKDRKIESQGALDSLMIELDGTENKSNLGANTILGVSMAFAAAAAQKCGIPLYQYISNIAGTTPAMPAPLVNIINGGAHASNKLLFQEFMVAPAGTLGFKEGIMVACDIFRELKIVLQRKQHSRSVGDEGGFAPDISTENEALELLVSAIESSKNVLGKDVFIALDVAANHFYKGGYYILNGRKIDSAQLVNHYAWLMKQFPIISIEDPLAEEDVEGWKLMTQMLGGIVQIVGDDIFVTNPKILSNGIEQKIANAILLKPNQIGTLTETCEAANIAVSNGYGIIVSHRSGETEDTTIAHLAVGLGGKQIKSGSVCRSERTAKYNELIRIEESWHQDHN